MPTSEELKYFIALNGVITEKMRAIRDSDRIFITYRSDETCGMYLRGCDDVLCVCTSKYGKANFNSDNLTIIRLSLPIDPENPERGLVGMFKPNTFIYLGPVFCLSADNGNVDDSISTHTGEWACKVKGLDYPFLASTPTLALLKALAAQEGIEVT